MRRFYCNFFYAMQCRKSRAKSLVVVGFFKFVLTRFIREKSHSESTFLKENVFIGKEYLFTFYNKNNAQSKNGNAMRKIITSYNYVKGGCHSHVKQYLCEMKINKSSIIIFFNSQYYIFDKKTE